jgi:hypothetical protein
MTELAELLRGRPHLAECNPDLLAEVGVVSHSRRRSKIKTSLWQDETAMCRSFDEHVLSRAKSNPLYGLLYHIPNEDSHKIPGVRGGVPDYHLPVAKPYLDEGVLRYYHSLWLEFKTADGDLSPKQLWWITRLSEQGNLVKVIWENLDDALRILDWYLEDNDGQDCHP